MLDELLLLFPGLALVCTGNIVAACLGGLLILSSFFYAWVWLPYKNNGQDLSKRLLGMQIVNQKENSTPNLTQLIIRAILKPLGCPLCAASILIITMVEITRKDKKDFLDKLLIGTLRFFVYPSLHDRFAGTTVACSTKDDFMNLSRYCWY